MTREEAIKALKKWRQDGIMADADLEMVIKALEQEPSNDMVSRGVFEQVMWERDIAISQLKELGYELGQKIEPCEDAISREQIKNAYTEWYGKYADSVFLKIIHDMPPATPKQRTGHWVESYINQIKGCDDIGHFYVCTECGRYINLRQGAKLSDYPYCHCGVKMEEQK